VAERYPVHKIDDVYNFEKYDRPASRSFLIFIWAQLLLLLMMISYLFANIAVINELNSTFIYWYGALIFLSVFALTELMDQHPYAVGWEAIRAALGLGLLYWQADWFGAGQFFSPIVPVLTGYFLFSLLMTAWFSNTERKKFSESTAR
jgi:hypothetical protein